MNPSIATPAGLAGAGQVPPAPVEARQSAAVVGTTARDTAIRMLAAGLWPTVIPPNGAKLGKRIYGGKEPFGKAWGVERKTVDTLAEDFRRFPDAGVGVCLGPGRGPGGSWLIDVEGDGDEAEASRLKLFGAEVIESFGWSSARGAHLLLLADPDRVGELLKPLDHLRGKGSLGTGVYKFPGFPDLEIRFGGFSPKDGKPLQFHSVMPPTVGTDGEPREWNGVTEIATVPESFYAALTEAAASKPPAPTKPPAEKTASRAVPAKGDVEARVVAYLAKCDPAVSGNGGHDQAFKVACKVGPGFDLHPDTAFRLLQTHYNPRCEPPWTEAELRHKIADAYATEPRRGWIRDAERDGGKPAKSSTNGRHGATAVNGEVAPPLGGVDATVRPDVCVTADEHLAVDHAAESFVGREDIFVRGGQLVRVQRQPATEIRQRRIKREAETPVVTLLGEAAAGTELSRSLRFLRWDARSKEWVQTAPPARLVRGILAKGTYPRGRELIGVIEAPTLRPDGSVLSRPGYDAATGLLYEPSCAFPEIPDHPTRDDARKAAARITQLVCDFPFAEEHSKAAWFAYLLSILCRPAVDGPVPLTMFTANVAGSGKTYLATLPAKIATGRDPAMDGYADDDAEMEKRLVAIALGGDAAVVWDNAPNGASIGGAALDRALSTDGVFRGRVLGKSQMSDGDGKTELPWRTVQAVTGNALITKADTRRRTSPVYLDYDKAKPEQRDPETFTVFKETGLTLAEYVKTNRANLVADALVVVRAYIAAGRPSVGKITPMGDPFGEWDRTIRRAVIWAHGHDPLGERGRLDQGDETTQRAEALVSAWSALCAALDDDDTAKDKPPGKHAGIGVSAAEAAESLARWQRGSTPGAPPSHADVLRLFAPFAGRSAATPDARTLGYALRPVNGVRTDSGVIRSRPPQRGVVRWTVETAPDGGGDGGDGGDGGHSSAESLRTVTGGNGRGGVNWELPAVTSRVDPVETYPPSPPSPPLTDCPVCFRLDCPGCPDDAPPLVIRVEGRGTPCLGMTEAEEKLAALATEFTQRGYVVDRSRVVDMTDDPSDPFIASVQRDARAYIAWSKAKAKASRWLLGMLRTSLRTKASDLIEWGAEVNIPEAMLRKLMVETDVFFVEVEGGVEFWSYSEEF